jgi:hypothetical protein
VSAPDANCADSAQPLNRKGIARWSTHNSKEDVLLAAARSGWGPTLRYGLLLLIHRAPLPIWASSRTTLPN